MPVHDQFGRPISVGDTVTIKGEVTKVLDNPGYLNCTVKLAQKMPPAGSETHLELNSAQVEKTGGKEAGGKETGGKETGGKETGGAPTPPQSHAQPQGPPQQQGQQGQQGPQKK